MIKFEKTEVVGWEAAIRGMRNPMNSWEKSDSGWLHDCMNDKNKCPKGDFKIGPNDLELMKKLRNAGTDHRKFMRMIVVYVDITAPLYWWKEFDTYKVGTVANSCSTMHKIADKEFELDDFSFEHLNSDWTTEITKEIIDFLNSARESYIETKDKHFWWDMIQLLPSSYNQKRTVMMSYEVLANIYKSRKDHKQDEWKKHKERIIDSTSQALYAKDDDTYFGLCDWIETLPYSELITGPVFLEKEMNIHHKEPFTPSNTGKSFPNVDAIDHSSPIENCMITGEINNNIEKLMEDNGIRTCVNPSNNGMIISSIKPMTPEVKAIFTRMYAAQGIYNITFLHKEETNE